MRLFTWSPEWSNSAKVKIRWKTKVQESLSSRENRLAQAPRPTLEATFHYAGVEGRESDSLKIFMTKTRDERIVWPLWTRQTVTAAIVDSTHVRLPIARSVLFLDRYLVLHRSWAYCEASPVVSVGSDGILTLGQALTMQWATDDLAVVGIQGYINSSPDGNQNDDESFEGDITFVESIGE